MHAHVLAPCFLFVQHVCGSGTQCTEPLPAESWMQARNAINAAYSALQAACFDFLNSSSNQEQCVFPSWPSHSPCYPVMALPGEILDIERLRTLQRNAWAHQPISTLIRFFKMTKAMTGLTPQLGQMPSNAVHMHESTQKCGITWVSFNCTVWCTILILF